MEKQTLEGYSSRDVKPIWDYGNSIWFNYSIHKEKLGAIQAVAKDKVAKIRVTVEVVDE